MEREAKTAAVRRVHAIKSARGFALAAHFPLYPLKELFFHSRLLIRSKSNPDDRVKWVAYLDPTKSGGWLADCFQGAVTVTAQSHARN